MNQQIKAQWVAALRSGAYEQCRLNMQAEGQYCVLGVLCDLHSKATGTPWQWTYSLLQQGMVATYLGLDRWIPYTVREWAELHEQACGDLYGKNDSGSTFAELADYIEGRY